MWTRTFEGGGVSRVIYTLFIGKDKALPADSSILQLGWKTSCGVPSKYDFHLHTCLCISETFYQSRCSCGQEPLKVEESGSRLQR